MQPDRDDVRDRRKNVNRGDQGDRGVKQGGTLFKNLSGNQSVALGSLLVVYGK